MRQHLRRNIGDDGSLAVDMWQEGRYYLVITTVNGAVVEKTKHRKLDRAVEHYEKVLREF